MARSTIGLAMERRESVRFTRRFDAKDRHESVRSDRSDLIDSFLSRKSDRREPVRSITDFDTLLLEIPRFGL